MPTSPSIETVLLVAEKSVLHLELAEDTPEKKKEWWKQHQFHLRTTDIVLTRWWAVAYCAGLGSRCGLHSVSQRIIPAQYDVLGSERFSLDRPTPVQVQQNIGEPCSNSSLRQAVKPHFDERRDFASCLQQPWFIFVKKQKIEDKILNHTIKGVLSLTASSLLSDFQL